MKPIDKVIRGVIVPLHEMSIIMPNAAIAEVINYVEYEKIEQSPDWFLGFIDWRGTKIALCSFEAITGCERATKSDLSRIIVINRLQNTEKVAFYALLTQGIPRLTKVSRGEIIEEKGATRLPGVKQAVTVNGVSALIPDISVLSNMVKQVN